MSIRWFFTVDGDVAILRSRAVKDGTIVDQIDQIRAGDEPLGYPGLTFEALKAVGSGVLEVQDDGSFELKAND